MKYLRTLDNGHVVPDAPAYGTKLRWSAPKLIAAVNKTVPDANVRTLHVLAPAIKAGLATAAADQDPEPTAPTGAVRTRQTASAGYHQALAAHQTSRPERHVDPAIAEAIEAETRALREISRRAFPDPDPMVITRAKRLRDAKVTHAQALRRARAERAQRAETTSSAQAPTGRRTA